MPSPSASNTIAFTVNGQNVSLCREPMTPLSEVLREDLRLTGTKVGCGSGDCGACTVLLDDQQVCACLTPIAQCAEAMITTIEATDIDPMVSLIQHQFVQHGAVQCGFCIPGMVMAARELLGRNTEPSRKTVEQALGGVLCRCTGYVKIVDAVLASAEILHRGHGETAVGFDPQGPAVGQRMPRVDAWDKASGRAEFGADRLPPNTVFLRVIRSPHARAQFDVGDLSAFLQKYPGVINVLTASDVPGVNGFGVYPNLKDQPVLADTVVNFRGQAVMLLVGEADALARIDDAEVPIRWQPTPAISTVADALAPEATAINPDYAGDNVLTRGYLKRNLLPDTADRSNWIRAEGHWQTAYVEHAYMEPEAGYAQRIGDRIEVWGCTQAPYMDRDDVANIIGIAPESVRILPSACGGGFGGKLDVSFQPLVALAAWHCERPVAVVFSRSESMASSVKRHPADISASAACDSKGYLQHYQLDGDFNTGAYSSWGPTVAGRVPVHACGPYFVPSVEVKTRAIYTNGPPAGAFRGFGTPQAAIARELLYDQLADKVGLDRWQFRRQNALKAGQQTATGQTLAASVGMLACLQHIESDWYALLRQAERRNAEATTHRYGVGIACMWYGCGNTALSNPSTMRIRVFTDGRVVFYCGAVDIGQGSYTVMTQICADGLGLPAAQIELVTGDTDHTEDGGKTSASRQTFVSGKATLLTAQALRRRLLQALDVPESAQLSIVQGYLHARCENGEEKSLQLSELGDADGLVWEACESFDPPTTALDENGQGDAYATYAFAVQACLVAVDMALGSVKVERIVAAHDVGKAINPTQVEGQIEGGIMQGLGMALMEEYLPERTENLHDYLIPTIGDVPTIDIRLIEDPEPLGPYGAKGVGEPALVPTPAAILGAIRHATGVCMTQIPVLPHRLLSELEAQS